MIKNAVLLTMIGYLFYGVFWFAVPVFPILVILVLRDRRIIIERNREKLRWAFRDALHSMSAALHAGYAAENAVREAAKDLISIYGEQHPLVKEYQYMWNQIQMQIPIEQVWNEFGVRSRVPEISDFAAVFQTAKRTGGNMISIMDHSARVISEKIQVAQEIETILAAKKMEWNIMVIIPFAIIFYMKTCFSGFMSAMYGNPAGIIVMTIALLLFGIAWSIGNHILEIQV